MISNSTQEDVVVVVQVGRQAQQDLPAGGHRSAADEHEGASGLQLPASTRFAAACQVALFCIFAFDTSVLRDKGSEAILNGDQTASCRCLYTRRSPVLLVLLLSLSLSLGQLATVPDLSITHDTTIYTTICRYTYSVGEAYFGTHWKDQGSSTAEIAVAYGVYGSANIAGLRLLTLTHAGWTGFRWPLPISAHYLVHGT